MEYRCSRCPRAKTRSDFHEAKGRVVKSVCKGCRSRAYYARKYQSQCAACAAPRRININGKCRSCNAAAGLRQCARCGDLLPIELSFHAGRSRCTGCEQATRPRTAAPAA